MKIQELLKSIPFHQTTALLSDTVVTGIEVDSRLVRDGNIFVCIEGFTTDGHNYIQDAELNGAAAIISQKKVTANIPVIIVNDTNRALAMLASKFYQYPSNEVTLIGVTGTNGKTTVTYLLERIFQIAKKKTGVIGTIQMKIGEDTYPVENTTPNALELQKSLRKMVDEKVEHVLMEVSSHALDLGRVYGTDYDIAVFTNLSQDHLDYHSTLEDYLQAKSLLFSQLGNSYNKGKPRYAIVNQDDKATTLLKKVTAQPVLTYGCKNKADVEAKNIHIGASGTSFLLVTPIGDIDINSKLRGMFNVYNMLAAAACAIASNISLSNIKLALESMEGVSGRFEVVEEELPYTVIVDYAHTPDSLENVLQTIKEFSENKIYVVVGCGGDRDRTKRPLMANIAVSYADYAFFTSDNPRTEEPYRILEEMVDGLKKQTAYEVILDRKEAIYKAIHQAEQGDVVLIAGKGHETYQQIGLTKHYFDDREVAKQAIKSRE
ncbi:UDP-N-acetylmuramoyl-L-alanyl-D-glutamate--2,6-diaminopimelate ligase [Oceanobacillus piezotolerans]|uniref:UDP-N-acetylmuramoyl-L-alanyl-D-glutamate--2,6-diaminopimelate ligase n=1 Tax=Oceanobacillus piezotolerans TaxID=2448030 RepID=A0A498DE34_9BACI|nr:UDP-N-acetylmuramoyl-L-alanyl-D-glutamate--2,6-diaminopimelate ligase [Oceanobacillus piezotolerans]RLL45234.1 UDP-N-acetylmuramoyl-L-alanyl-D-glutamate--2,6-diaminopimelate ligase [Oceanobacillus piezotolerans]